MQYNIKNPVILSVILILVIINVAPILAIVPSTTHSQSMISRVAPDLKKEFETMGLKWGSPIFFHLSFSVDYPNQYDR